jgi:L-threonylcarbamoyladenylate synthase
VRVLDGGGGLPAEDAAGMRAALRAGEILLYPTDTMYAVGGLVLAAEAARRVRAAKGREAGKALPALAADEGQARELCGAVADRAWVLARVFWPGPLTLVLPASPALPREVAGEGTIAVRVPAHGLARDICRLAGPLISTSANRSGEPPALTCAAAIASLGEEVAFAIDGGPGSPTPSTIVDVTGPEPRLLRAGAVPWEDVLRAWA